jgi:hypothetical protein
MLVTIKHRIAKAITGPEEGSDHKAGKIPAFTAIRGDKKCLI